MCTCNNQLLPHDRMPGVCPETFRGMPVEEWEEYGALPVPCDDCHRTDGTHDLEVEH